MKGKFMIQHLYFLRHGDVQRTPSCDIEKDYPDYPLSDLGKQQADLLRQRLQMKIINGAVSPNMHQILGLRKFNSVRNFRLSSASPFNQTL
jgi:hypothetical protein